MIVLKFGGTSLGNPVRMQNLVELIKQNQKQIIVLSAVAGTTNKLLQITEFLYNNDLENALKEISLLRIFYHEYVNELFSDIIYKEKSLNLINEHFNYLETFTIDLFTKNEERIIIAQGELISTALFHFYLESKKMKSILLSALDFMKIDENAEPEIDFLRSNLKPILESNISENIIITQGFICRNNFGQIDNLKRGGSDYSASLIGAALLADEIQIWTDIDGMHNNDPRIVNATKPVPYLSFDEAAELAYFGAKILHPQSVLPAQKFGIPVRLLNTMEPNANGTLISSEMSSDIIKAIAAKDQICAIRIQSSRMLLAYGFLRRIFEIFERYKTPIDMISTSEVAVSITIDDSQYLDLIKTELQELGHVIIDKNLSIICIVGNFPVKESGAAAKVFLALQQIPIRMISYGGSDNNISVLVKTSDKKNALNALHQNLFS